MSVQKAFDPLVDALLGALIGASIPTLVLYRLRVRLLRSTLKWAAKSAPDELQDLALGTIMTWKEEKNEKGEVIRVYLPKPLLVNFLASVMPVAIQIGWSSFTRILPGLQGMTVGADGRPSMNFLIGPMKKLAEGKKVKFDDFVPAIMEKALPYIDKLAGSLTGMFGGASGSSSPGSSPPAKPPQGGGFNPG